MANLKDFTDSQVQGLLRDHEREIINTKTQYVDLSKTSRNVDLRAESREMGAYEYYLYRRNQAYLIADPDFTTLCSWIITAPRNVPEDRLMDFFRCFYEFNAQRYGLENIVACCVHFDESRPHSHLTVLPIVHDEKHNSEKFAPKQKFSRDDLLRYHGDLLAYMTQRLGFAPEVANKRGGAWHEEALKTTDGANRNANIRNEYESLNSAVNALSAQKRGIELEIQELLLKKTELVGAIRALNEEYVNKKAYIDSFKFETGTI